MRKQVFYSIFVSFSMLALYLVNWMVFLILGPRGHLRVLSSFFSLSDSKSVLFHIQTLSSHCLFYSTQYMEH